MTKYMTLDKKEKPEGKKTVFESIMMDNGSIDTTMKTPEKYEQVLFLGHDSIYGDVFKACNESDRGDFFIFLGVKGDEFDQ